MNFFNVNKKKEKRRKKNEWAENRASDSTVHMLIYSTEKKFSFGSSFRSTPLLIQFLLENQFGIVMLNYQTSPVNVAVDA